ncbi:MAG: hypothetical protein ILO53_08845 [Clostridia bacterium]|nr:hypothetical protein [Clostridia bacterium]
MSKSKRKFPGRLFGYSKKQVNAAMESAGKEITDLKSEADARNLQIESLSQRLAELEEERNFLREEAAAARREKDAIAKVLVDAQRRGDEIIDTAVQNAESETARLSVHADKVRSKISSQVSVVRSIEDASYDYVRAIIDQLKASADRFEQEIMDTVDESRRSADEFLDETEAVLDVDYFGEAGVERPSAAAKADAETEADEDADADSGKETGSAETPETQEDGSEVSGAADAPAAGGEDSTNSSGMSRGADEMPAFQSSDEAAQYFRVIRA